MTRPTSPDLVRQRCEVLDAYERFNARRRGRHPQITYWKKRIGMTVMGRLAAPAARRLSGEQMVCDVLFLHSWSGGPASIGALKKELDDRGLRRQETFVVGRRRRLWQRLLRKPAFPVPSRWRLDAYYAWYLVSTYQPRVIVCFDNASPLATWLRLALSGDGYLVNLSHSVTPPHDEANMFDYDFYFAFGPSSLDHAERKLLRIGSTRVVQTGYFWIGPDYQLPNSLQRDRLLFFSQLSSQLLRSSAGFCATKDLLLHNTKLVMEFAAAHPELTLYIKLHPLESPEHVTALAAGRGNVRILPKSIGMKDAVSLAPVAVAMWSNAALEAAVLGRPVVMLNDCDDPDTYLELEHFFLPRARTAADLYQRIRMVFENYDAFVEAARRFVKRHLTQTTEAVPYIASCLGALAQGRPDLPSVTLPERLVTLTTKPTEPFCRGH